MSLRLPPRPCEALAEAIHNKAHLGDSTPSLRDSVLAESWQSIIKHKANVAMESLRGRIIMGCHDFGRSLAMTEW